MWRIGVHPGLQHRDAAKALKLRGVRFVVEGTGDQDVEPAVCGLSRRLYQVRAGHRAELGADEDCRAALNAVFFVALCVAPIGADQPPGPGGDGREFYPVLSTGPAVRLRFSGLSSMTWAKSYSLPYPLDDSAMTSPFSSTPRTR